VTVIKGAMLRRRPERHGFPRGRGQIPSRASDQCRCIRPAVGKRLLIDGTTSTPACSRGKQQARRGFNVANGLPCLSRCSHGRKSTPSSFKIPWKHGPPVPVQEHGDGIVPFPMQSTDRDQLPTVYGTGSTLKYNILIQDLGRGIRP